MLHVNDPAVRRFIKRAKKWGYVTSDKLNEIMPPEVFSPNQVKDAICQLAEMGINVLEGDKALWGKEDQPGDAAEREEAPDDQPEAPAPSASASEGHLVVYSSVCEGYWDGSRWRSAGRVAVSQHTGGHCPRPRWLSSASDGSQMPVPNVCSPVEHHLILHWIDPV
jgi:hypothetical protein